MAKMTPWVRQYTLRDLLDDSFDLYKERFTTLLLAAVIPFVLIVLYLAIMRFFVVPGNFVALTKENISSQESLLDYLRQNLSLFKPSLFWFGLGYSIVSQLACGISYIAQCRIATWHALGEEFSLLQPFRLLAKPLGGLLLVSIIYSFFLGVAVVVGLFCLLFILGILSTLFLAIGNSDGSLVTGILAVIAILAGLVIFMLVISIISSLFISAPIVLAVEHTGPFAAISKSFSFTTMNFKAQTSALYVQLHLPFIFYVLISVAIYFLSTGLSTISPTITFALQAVLSGVGFMMCLGFISCFQALAYIDGRCRKDNLDLLLLGQEIGLVAEMNEVELAGAVNTPLSYPDYSAMPVSAAPAPAFTNHQVAAAPVMTAGAFPDYSAPPPALENEEPMPEGEHEQ